MAAVAVAYVALSLPNGGGSPTAISIGTLLVWWAVIVGLGVGGWPRGEIPRAAIAAGACLGGLALLSLLSIAWSEDDGRAFIEFVRVAGYAGLFVLVLISTPGGGGRPWLAGLAVGLAAVTLLALGSRLEAFLPGALEVSAILPADKGRLSYPIGYWNGLAACMALAIVLLAWFGTQAGTRLARALSTAVLPLSGLALYMSSSRGGFGAAAVALVVLVVLGPARGPLLARLALAGAGALLLAAYASTKSALLDDPPSAAAASQGDQLLAAAVIVVVVIGIVSYLADNRIGRLSLPTIPPRVGIAALAVVLIAAAVIVNPAERVDRFNDAPTIPGPAAGAPSNKLASSTGSGRYQFWGTALDAFESKPLTGIGAGGYETWWNTHGSLTNTVRHAHSLFMEMLAELGLAGLALVAAFLAIPIVAGAHRLRGSPVSAELGVGLALVAAGIVSAFLEWTWYLTATFVPVLVAAALLSGPASVISAPRSVPPEADGTNGGTPTRSRTRFGWGVATLLGGWVAVLAALALLLTETRLSDSRQAARDGDLAAAARAADDAETLQPWAADPRLQLALVEEAGGDLSGADETIDEAIDRAPDDYRLWLVKARIQAGQGKRQLAHGSLYRAASLTRQPQLIEDHTRGLLGGGGGQ